MTTDLTIMTHVYGDRARGVVRLIDYGHQNVGRTERCAYRLTLAQAEARARELNNLPEVSPEQLISYGSA
jgi:hypothetical protein